MGEEKRGIEQHAHRGEKQQAEDVAQRNDVAQGLVAVFGFAEDHAGDKGAEGKGQPEQIGGIADPEADGGDRQEEQFAGVPGGDVASSRGISLVPTRASGREKERP